LPHHTDREGPKRAAGSTGEEQAAACYNAAASSRNADTSRCTDCLNHCARRTALLCGVSCTATAVPPLSPCTSPQSAPGCPWARRRSRRPSSGLQAQNRLQKERGLTDV
jgi:hypothetical protein